jgi:hypothetical protein
LALLQGSSELAAFVAGIGYYRSDSRKQHTQSAKQQSARQPIGCVSRFDTVSNQQAKCVDQDVAFASLYALMRVETTSTTTLGRLDRLAIHNHHRWTSCPSGVTAGLLVEHSM